MCYMVERVERKIKQKNSYVINTIGRQELTSLICLANVLHCENHEKIVDEWIEEYGLENGTYNNGGF